jgi:hypothetical protein
MRTLMFCVFLLVGLGVLICTEEIFVIDLQAVSPNRFPSQEFWNKHLEEHKKEIFDGSSDTDFLNTCFLGGWNKCITRFANNYSFMPWNYYVVQKVYPMDLGGNMADTERVAGQLGWKAATDEIEKTLINTSESTLRSRVFYINKRVVWVVGVGIAVAVACAILDLSKTRVWGLSLTKRSSKRYGDTQQP